MSQPARKKYRRRTRSGRSPWRVLRLTAILSFACLAVLVVIVALLESAHLPLGQHAAAGACNATVVTSNQAPPARWFSINSGSAADILSAVRCTDMFQNASQGNDLIASALRSGTLASPVLVKPYRSDVGLSQFWVVPVVDKNGLPLALFTFFYNPQTHLIHEGEFDAVTGDMFYVNHSFPAVTASMSVAAVSAQQHVAVVQGQSPDLIYFPGDFNGAKIGKNAWNGGGTAVIDPIWRVPGADSQWRYVDHNGLSHMSAELPVDPHFQVMPATTTTQ